MKNCVKFNSIEELNKACENGLTIYSIAQCGAGWFVEYETNKVERVPEQPQKKMSVYDFMNKCIELEFIKIDGCQYRMVNVAQFKALALSTFTKDTTYMLEGIKNTFRYASDKWVVEDIIKIINNN